MIFKKEAKTSLLGKTVWAGVMKKKNVQLNHFKYLLYFHKSTLQFQWLVTIGIQLSSNGVGEK